MGMMKSSNRFLVKMYFYKRKHFRHAEIFSPYSTQNYKILYFTRNASDKYQETIQSSILEAETYENKIKLKVPTNSNIQNSIIDYDQKESSKR